MKLYKYLRPDKTIILKNESIRYTQASFFNDPFELLPYIESIVDENSFSKFMNNALKTKHTEIEYKFFEEGMKKLKNVFTQPALNFGVELATMYKNDFDKTHGILSLTKTKNNLVMWAHYALDHTGFLIEFNQNLWKPDLGRILNTKIIQLKNVKYSKERPIIPSIIEQFKNENGFEKFYIDFLTTKSMHWKYEKEIRLIRDLKDATEKIKENTFLFSFNTNAISSIILGVNIKPTAKEEILSFIQEPRYSHVKVFQAQLHKTEYKLIFEKLN